jgi:hypothetical protein
MVQKKSGKW